VTGNDSGGGGQPPDGLLLIDKPRGITSHDAIDDVRRAIGTRKVGHAGTLDPMATGLLLVGVGRATRLLRFLSDLPKTYEGTARLGEETDTLDADGEIVRTRPVAVSSSDIEGAFAAKLGRSRQRPPAYSAVKVAGRPLYKAARAGEQVEAQPRSIRVDAFELLGLRGADATFRVTCAGGTYVRVLLAEVGEQLGCGAHLVSLRRTGIGAFRVDDARPPSDPGPPLAMEDALAHLPSCRVSAEEAIAVSHGRILGPAGIAGPYAVVSPEGRLLGIYRDDGAKARPEVVLAPAS